MPKRGGSGTHHIWPVAGRRASKKLAAIVGKCSEKSELDLPFVHRGEVKFEPEASRKPGQAWGDRGGCLESSRSCAVRGAEQRGLPKEKGRFSFH